MCKKQSNVTIKLSCGKNDVKKMNCVKCVWGGELCKQYENKRIMQKK